MANNMYRVEDFDEHLSKLTIGTEDVQKLMEFVRLQERRFRWQAKRLETAASLIGHNTINECLMDEDYE